MEMPWTEARMADSAYYPEHDTIFLVPVDVQHDSICYVETGVKEQGTRTQGQGLGIRAQGRSVELTLDRPTTVEIQVFTADGRQVARIGRTEYSAGRHEVRLPEGIAAGAYIVSATGGGRSASTKVVRF